MSQDTPFSFHCMICYEEFHPEHRYPVVLPCGHTYICHLCADRLDRCMECRTPLYEVVPATNSADGATIRPSPSHPLPSSSWSSSARYSGGGGGGGRVGRSEHSARPSVTKRRLTLPKNVVLLSLIEATELASADARSKFNNASDSPPVNGKKTHQENVPSEDVSPPQQTLLSMGSMIDAEDEEEEKIKMSTSLAIGVAGTYAVAAKEGLDIYPSRPSSDKEDEDVDTLVRFFHLDQNSPGKKKRMGSKKGSPLKGSPLKGSPGDKLQTGLLKLSFGDRVQIVSFDGGWAKLARGYGFVRAGKNELVKVGGPVDRACKLEAMLCTLSNRRKELRHEQTKIDNQFIRFMNDLQVSLQSDEDLTVIVADAFAASDSNIVRELAYVEKEEKKTSLEEERNDYASIQKPAQLERQITPPSQGSNISGMPRFACFAGSVFGDSDDSSRERRATQSLRSVLTHPERSPSANDDATSPRDASAMFSSSTNTSPSAMRAGAQAWRDQHGINFKSGLSGHMGLLSTHAHAHGYLEPTRRSTRTTAFPHMSSHTGLTVPKAPSMQNILSSLTLPVIGTPPRQQSPRQQIQQSGSM